MIRRVAVGLAWMLLLALPVVAQEWVGESRARGIVLDAAGAPLAGATVRLRQADAGPAAMQTDSRGRWSVGRLAAGPWVLTIEAPGHIVSHGRITLPPRGTAPRIRVQLRSIEEQSPSVSEGSASAIRSWIDKGDSLTSQGRYEEAGAEYDKALAELPPDRSVRLLHGVARKQYAAGQVERAWGTLLRALRAAPEDFATRAVMRRMCAELQRCDGLDELFVEAATAGEEPALEEAKFVAGPREVARETIALPSHKPGRFRVRFEQRATEGGDLAIEHESFELFVPGHYSADRPFGLLVWVSPVDHSSFPQEATRRMLADANMIGVTANRSGNSRAERERMLLALEAAVHIGARYTIDPRRTYVAGYSGGGRMASQLLMLHPGVFNGGIFAFGCNFYRDLAVPDRPGAHWPASFPRPERRRMAQLKKERHMVLMTGELDFNRAQTRVTYEALKRDGFRHAHYVEIPGATHYEGFDADWFSRGLQLLDEEAVAP